MYLHSEDPADCWELSEATWQVVGPLPWTRCPTCDTINLTDEDQEPCRACGDPLTDTEDEGSAWFIQRTEEPADLHGPYADGTLAAAVARELL